MDKVSELSREDRRDLFVQTARDLGFDPAVVEKDFWVCWVLRRLFQSPELSKQLVFKGGTSLSKVHHLIERFSEDIDLVLGMTFWTDYAFSKNKSIQPRRERPNESGQARTQYAESRDQTVSR